MKALIISSPPLQNYSVFIMPKSEMDTQWYDLYKKKLIEAEIDEKKALIEIEDIHKIHFTRLKLIQFIIKLGFGMSADHIRKFLIEKYGNSVKHEVIAICLYRIIEVA